MKQINGAARTSEAASARFMAPRSRRSLLAAAPFALSMASAMVFAGPANAACLQSGSTVTCSGLTTTGFGTGVENNLSVTVQPDASIIAAGAQHAIMLNN